MIIVSIVITIIAGRFRKGNWHGGNAANQARKAPGQKQNFPTNTISNTHAQ
jgi:hypothetical protein